MSSTPAHKPRPRLSDVAADHVRELIVSGQLAPGEYVRPEILAEELGISATPAREGLLTLQSEGFLRVEPRKGFAVAALSTDDIIDVYTGQSLIGGELAARAAERVTDIEIEELGADPERPREGRRRAVTSRPSRRSITIFTGGSTSSPGSPKLRWMIRSTLGYAPRKFFPAVEGWPEASAARPPGDHRPPARPRPRRRTRGDGRARAQRRNTVRPAPLGAEGGLANAETRA